MSFQAWFILILIAIIVIGGIVLWMKLGRLMTKGAKAEIKIQKTEIKLLTKEVKANKKEKEKWDAKIKDNKNLKGINSIADLVAMSNRIKRF